jgi:hypothetical protein
MKIHKPAAAMSLFADCDIHPPVEIHIHPPVEIHLPVLRAGPFLLPVAVNTTMTFKNDGNHKNSPLLSPASSPISSSHSICVSVEHDETAPVNDRLPFEDKGRKISTCRSNNESDRDRAFAARVQEFI